MSKLYTELYSFRAFSYDPDPCHAEYFIVRYSSVICCYRNFFGVFLVSIILSIFFSNFAFSYFFFQISRCISASHLFWFIHSHACKVLENDVIIIIGIVRIFISMSFDWFHFLHCVDPFTFNRSYKKKSTQNRNSITIDCIYVGISLWLLPGAGCINLNGTSVTNSPPSVPQLTLTRIEYEMTMPMASVDVLPSPINVDDAKLTSSSFKWPSNAMPTNQHIHICFRD